MCNLNEKGHTWCFHCITPNWNVPPKDRTPPSSAVRGEPRILQIVTLLLRPGPSIFRDSIQSYVLEVEKETEELLVQQLRLYMHELQSQFHPDIRALMEILRPLGREWLHCCPTAAAWGLLGAAVGAASCKTAACWSLCCSRERAALLVGPLRASSGERVFFLLDIASE